MSENGRVIVKTYKGSQERASEDFRADAVNMAADGYYPTSQSWASGEYGCGMFLLALLLCFAIVGFFIFIYMLIVKPDGTLSVTYEYRTVAAPAARVVAPAVTTCPKCAEQVKAAAVVCRFCRYEFV